MASHRPSEASASIIQSPFCSSQRIFPANVCGQGSSPCHATSLSILLHPGSYLSRPSRTTQANTNIPSVTSTTVGMGLSRKSSSTNTPALARTQPSNTHLNGLGKSPPNTPNGVATPVAGHDSVHSANSSSPSSPAGSISSGADGKEPKFFDQANGTNNVAPLQSPDKCPKDKLDKNRMGRIGRMFSQSGRDKDKREKEKERKQQNMLGSGAAGIEPSHSGPTSPMPRHSEKERESFSDTDGAPSRGSSVAGDHPPKPRSVSGQHKNGETAANWVRFEMLEDGVNHVHHLRAAKRQEKLSKLLQSWLGGGQRRREEEDGRAPPARDQLSLMHSWVDQWKTEKSATSKKDGAQTPPTTLVEKYGRCQEVIGRGAFPRKHYADNRCLWSSANIT